MLDYATTGTLLGLSAGLAPGPLLALVLSESLRHGIRSGVMVALSPLITDLPIILLSLFLLSRLSDSHVVLGIVSLLGGVVILRMGWSNLNPRPEVLVTREQGRGSLWKGVLANTFNPHPYLFWLSVGAPIMYKALEQSQATLAAFVGCFYVALVGSKVVLAVVVGRSRRFLNSAVYVWILRLLGLLLCILALFLFKEGLDLLGLLP